MCRAIPVRFEGDGSTDGTGDIAAALGLPGVRVARQPNGGQAAALRTGTRLASHDILVILDGRHLVRERHDPDDRATLRDPKVGAGCWDAGSTWSTSAASTSTAGCWT